MSDFTMYSGDSKEITVTVRDADGVIVNLTGYAITWALSLSVYDSAATISKTINSGIEVTNAAGGQFKVTISPADTAELRGSYYFESSITQNGSVSTILTGTATILPSLI